MRLCVLGEYLPDPAAVLVALDGTNEVSTINSTCSACIMHNKCMTLIQIRDVPEAVRDGLARKAAAAGQSMQSYLLSELTRLAEKPSMAEITQRAQARAKASGSTVTMQDAVAAVRAVRDRQEP